MNSALGMMELYGYLPAVEALDAALKAANVSLVDVVKVGGGLVTALIEGDVGAVRAAVDAGVTAAKRVGRVIAHHVIPRPADGSWRMILSDVQKRGRRPPGESGKRSGAEKAAEAPGAKEASGRTDAAGTKEQTKTGKTADPDASQSGGITSGTTRQLHTSGSAGDGGTFASGVLHYDAQAADTKKRSRHTDTKEGAAKESDTSKAGDAGRWLTGDEQPKLGEPDTDIGRIYTRPELRAMTVQNLRKLARQIGVTGMTRQELRFAKKEELIRSILETKPKEG